MAVAVAPKQVALTLSLLPCLPLVLHDELCAKPGWEAEHQQYLHVMQAERQFEAKAQQFQAAQRADAAAAAGPGPTQVDDGGDSGMDLAAEADGLFDD